ncbi:hypothetical protein TEA_010203 [Camellia sinensis var. sinensis]|uniref:non-specific serine/threonine protein kinase n=1 Tax=Camellia sinensis var. sinensis TaxID=542762 RepID=A0A4S4EUE0_CAMSN|nr:hypothetical protein TEA_010203 [Camellia sinensis var. sinensis]
MTWHVYNTSYVHFTFLTPNGTLKLMYKDEKVKNPYVCWMVPVNRCDIYGVCGPFGVCNMNKSPNCECLKGLVPNSIEDWKKGNWAGGCVRKTDLLCQKNASSLASSGKAQNDGFWKLSSMKLPDHYEYLYTKDSSGKDKKNDEKFIISFTTISGVVLLGAFMCSLHRWRANQRVNKENRRKYFDMVDSVDTSELPITDFDKILAATDNFSTTKQLGEGGFGPVYKERNFQTCFLLVHALDATKRVKLDWAKRFHIIQGIARGLLYLHRDSCLRVIHRLLKASNILLDDDMNPKISVFGLALTFQVTQELANTHRVVGTFGYMSPEYAMGGLFSEKSNIYSFGAFLLEMVNGMRNTCFHYHEKYLNLLRLSALISPLHAWKLCNESQASDLVDEDHVADRPTMSAVVLMLSNEIDLPHPKQPTFTIQSLSDVDLRSQLAMSSEYALRGLFSEKSDVFNFSVLLLDMAWELYNKSGESDIVDELGVTIFLAMQFLKQMDEARRKTRLVAIVGIKWTRGILLFIWKLKEVIEIMENMNDKVDEWEDKVDEWKDTWQDKNEDGRNG